MFYIVSNRFKVPKLRDVKNLNFIEDNLLMSDFNIHPLKQEGFKENIEPLYILDINEDISEYFVGQQTWMAVDQGEVENIDV